MFHRPKQQLVHKQMPARMSGIIADYAENRAEKSDPENHIYEMIDESEVSGDIFQVPSHPPPTGDETKANTNLFQNLLRAEMMNQIQSCNKIGSNGYLSHLPQQKRMDIIQETALGLASAAYLEKLVVTFWKQFREGINILCKQWIKRNERWEEWMGGVRKFCRVMIEIWTLRKF